MTGSEVSARRQAATRTPAARAAWIAYGTALAAGLVLGGLAATVEWAPERELWLTRATGWSAFAALALALSASPIARGLAATVRGGAARRQVVALRRAFGVTAAWAAAVHGGWAFFVYLGASWRAVTYQPYLRAGLTTLAVLLALLLTSYPWIVRRLRVRLWKPLHRLAYVAALLLLQHLLLSPFAPKRLVLTLFAALAAIQLLRLLPRAGR